MYIRCRRRRSRHRQRTFHRIVVAVALPFSKNVPAISLNAHSITTSANVTIFASTNKSKQQQFSKHQRHQQQQQQQVKQSNLYINQFNCKTPTIATTTGKMFGPPLPPRFDNCEALFVANDHSAASPSPLRLPKFSNTPPPATVLPRPMTRPIADVASSRFIFTVAAIIVKLFIATTTRRSRHCNIRLHTHLIIMIILAGRTHWYSCLPDGRATCRSVPGLTKDQLELCYKASDVSVAALEGLDLAIHECQVQFQWHRWNCSSLSTKSRNPHASNLLRKGYRESAFAFAISAAGVAHSVARACSQGRLMSCGCDPSINRKSLNKNLRQSLDKEKKLFLQYLETNQILTPEDEKKYERAKIASRWKWGGCSHNMDFGVEFSKLFLDCREKAGDIQSKINLHNNHAGRIAVSNNMEFRCKCHGMSGSCQLKTCWKSAPNFHVVGKVLKHQFRRALLVDQSNLGNGEPIVVLKRSRNKKTTSATNGERNDGRNGHERAPRKTTADKNAQRTARKLEASLFYYQRSPNFCERDFSADIQGTIGRKCNRNSTASDGCSSLCCGRGYSLVKEKRAERCHCKFQWCCSVECEECQVEEWISVCN